MQKGFSRLDDIAVTLFLFGSLRGLIHPSVSQRASKNAALRRGMKRVSLLAAMFARS
jgi:hypothetical protein